MEQKDEKQLDDLMAANLQETIPELTDEALAGLDFGQPRSDEIVVEELNALDGFPVASEAPAATPLASVAQPEPAASAPAGAGTATLWLAGNTEELTISPMPTADESAAPPDQAPTNSPGLEARLAVLGEIRERDLEHNRQPIKDDPVHRAAVKVFSENGYSIKPDDDVYALMKFMYSVLSEFEVKITADRKLTEQITLNRIETLRVHTLQATEDAKVRQEALFAEGLDFLKKSIQLAESKFGAWTTEAEAAAEAAMKGKIRQLIAEEVRIGVRSALDAEIQLLRSSTEQMRRDVEAAAAGLKTAQAPGGAGPDGWLSGAKAAFTALPGNQKLIAVGVGILLVAAILF